MDKNRFYTIADSIEKPVFYVTKNLDRYIYRLSKNIWVNNKKKRVAANIRAFLLKIDS